MQALSSLFQEVKREKIKGSERNDIMRQIWSFYDTNQEYGNRKRANWKRYVQYLKDNRLKDSKELQKKFTKSKMFIKPMTPASMGAFFLNKTKTKDLYEVLSVAKDKYARNESVGAYIMSLKKN